MRLTALSWNIWGGKYRDQVIHFLKNSPCDVVALQEVSERMIEGRKVNDAQEIADALGFHVAYAKAFRTDRHVPIYDLGNAILSKFPLKNIRTHELSGLESYERNATTEPRNAVLAEIALNDTSVTIISTHLGYSETLQATSLQMHQVKKLLDNIPQQKSILLGDFNSVPTSQVVTTILQKYRHTDSHLDRHSWTNMKKDGNPKFRIDYIFATPDIQTSSFHIQSSHASDHLPIIAELEIPEN